MVATWTADFAPRRGRFARRTAECDDAAMNEHSLVDHHRYLVRRKILTVFGAKFHVYDETGELLLFTRQKAFKLKEDLRLYADETQQQELMRISARQVIDFGATYDVIDSSTGAPIGSLRRRGLKSMVRDQWTFFDVDGGEIARLVEDSTALALLRRFVGLASLFFPQKHHVEMNGRTIGTYQQAINPFVHKIRVDFSDDAQHELDRRVALAGAILLCAIEGRQR
jgi:hypothetical protein